MLLFHFFFFFSMESEHMNQMDMFSGGFPTNRIPVKIPSTGEVVFIRETTVVELKSMCKTVIDNLGRR